MTATTQRKPAWLKGRFPAGPGFARIERMHRELWRNESPDWGGTIKQDRLYRTNNSLFNKDKATYLRRKRAGFPHDRLQPAR